MNKEWIEAVKLILEKEPGIERCGQTYMDTIYVDSNDSSLTEWTLSEMFSQKNPREYFFELVSDWEQQQIPFELGRIEELLKNHLEEEIVDLYWDEISLWVDENIEFHYKENQFNGAVCFNIVVDTGDGNVDFTLNNEISYYTDPEDFELDEAAGIVWLTEQQGYKKIDAENALIREDYKNSMFLKSLAREVMGCSTHINGLCFMISLSLYEAFDLIEAFNKEEILNNDLDFAGRRGTGFIVLDKSVKCGLYDWWNGSGGYLDIKLEEDVVLPFKCLSSIGVDGALGHSISKIYGSNKNNWSKNVLKEIHPS